MKLHLVASRGRLAALLWPASVLLLPLLFWPQLAFAGRILVGVDLFTYFYPLRDYTSAQLLAGRPPLWNPYLFLGVPLLGNSQAGALYPLNLLLTPLPAPTATTISILLHLGLAGLGVYVFARRSLELGQPAAWGAGVVYALGGFLSAQAEHVNQLAVSAWLPWMLWLFDAAVGEERGAAGRLRRRPLAGLALLAGIAFLAGHTQAWYISMFALGLSALGAALRRASARWPAGWGAALRAGWGALWPRGLALALAAGGGLALAALQLAPTLELAPLSIRGGGLSYREAVAFSLKPQLLLRALLPGYGESVFSEYVAYIGWVGLALAGVGLWCGRGRRAWSWGAGFALSGLALAFGGYNPLYYALYRLLPGFGMFRAPARWLVLYALGMALLAGLGLEHWRAAPRRARPLWLLGAALILALALWRGWLERPAGSTLMGWGAALLGVGLLALMRRMAVRRGGASPSLPSLPFRARPAPPFTALALAALLAELFLAGRALALATPTTWDAFAALRTAPAHLLAAGARVGADGRPLDEGSGAPAALGDPTAHWGQGAPTFRFLSMSATRFDPGDLAELRSVWGARLPDKAVYDFIVATKHKEVLAPNLPLLYRIAGVDGYDGGVLPLRRYVALQRLFLAPEQILPDGRLREQLREVPPARLLALLNVEYVITDKVQDVWLEDVFYDLQFGATLGQGGAGEVEVENPYTFVATALGLALHSEAGQGPPAGAPALVVSWRDEAGRRYERTLDAGAAAGDYTTRLRLDAPARPADIRLRWVGAAGRLRVRGLTLIDERAGTHRSLVVSDRGRFRLTHSGDVKVYRNLDNLPRAYWVSGARVIADDEAAIAALRDAGFDPRREVILHAGAGRAPLSSAQSRVELVAYAAGRVEVLCEADAPGYLVLSDAHYPGWRVEVNGRPARLERANVLLRAVELPAGRHEVVFRYAPAWLWPAALLSLLAAAALLWLACRAA